MTFRRLMAAEEAAVMYVRRNPSLRKDMIEPAVVGKAVVSAALKPVLCMVQQQWARRGAVALDSAQLTTLRAEVDEAIAVLARDSNSLHQATFIWLKGLVSDVSPVFDDTHVRDWLKTEGAATILLATEETLLHPRDAARRSNRRKYSPSRLGDVGEICSNTRRAGAHAEDGEGRAE
jgi:hypothetical protein